MSSIMITFCTVYKAQNTQYRKQKYSIKGKKNSHTVMPVVLWPSVMVSSSFYCKVFILMETNTDQSNPLSKLIGFFYLTKSRCCNVCWVRKLVDLWYTQLGLSVLSKTMRLGSGLSSLYYHYSGLTWHGKDCQYVAVLCYCSCFSFLSPVRLLSISSNICFVYLNRCMATHSIHLSVVFLW